MVLSVFVYIKVVADSAVNVLKRCMTGRTEREFFFT